MTERLLSNSREELQRRFDRLRTPTDPQALVAFANASSLPPAGEHTNEIALLTGPFVIVASDGVNWRRMDTGATVA